MTILLTLALLAAQTPAKAPGVPISDMMRLEQASNKGDLAVVDELLTANPQWADAKDDAGVSFMLNALYRRRADVVQAYVKRRSSFNLFEASALGRTNDLEAILKKDPGSVNSYSIDGFIALGLASFFAHEGAVSVLLANGADVKLFSKTPRVQALHSAAAGRCVECVRALLAAGADPDSPQDGGFRALHEAAANNDRAMAELLVAKGATPDVKDDKGKTSADRARGRGHAEIAAWLDSLKR